jgi:hypothetical protein
MGHRSTGGSAFGQDIGLATQHRGEGSNGVWDLIHQHKFDTLAVITWADAAAGG